MQCYKNAEPIEHIHLLDRAFHYGDGCFSTARIRNNQVELRHRHLARLAHAKEHMHLTANLELINKTLADLKQKQGKLNGTLKIVLSRGEGQRGYSLPEHPADVWVFFYPKAVDDFQVEKIKSGLLQQVLGLTMPSLVGLKSLNRLKKEKKIVGNICK